MVFGDAGAVICNRDFYVVVTLPNDEPEVSSTVQSVHCIGYKIGKDL